jgi:dipeptidyl aminopeptidase/acylaminoacyl peptidase
MHEEKVEFFSEGTRVSGMFRTAESAGDGPMPAIVQGPGWLGLKDSKLYVRYHEALTQAGFGVLIFDYRGFGDSDGDRGLLLPSMQLEDLVNAVTYLTTRDDVDATRIGVFGSGGTGGGNAVLLAARDERVRCAVSQVPVADGRDWLRRMRREYEWFEFLGRLEADRRARVLTGQGEMVAPRDGIMVATPERQKTTVKADVDDKIPNLVPLRGAEAILDYQPVDEVHRISPRALMIIGVDEDATTPTDHAYRLYEAAAAPKRLVIQRHTTHYAAYDRYWTAVTPMIVEWFQRYLVAANLDVREDGGAASSQEFVEVKEETTP